MLKKNATLTFSHRNGYYCSLLESQNMTLLSLPINTGAIKEYFQPPGLTYSFVKTAFEDKRENKGRLIRLIELAGIDLTQAHLFALESGDPDFLSFLLKYSQLNNKAYYCFLFVRALHLNHDIAALHLMDKVGKPVTSFIYYKEYKEKLVRLLFTAIELGDQKKALALLTQGVNPNGVHSFDGDFSPLGFAYVRQSLTIVFLLVPFGARFNDNEQLLYPYFFNAVPSAVITTLEERQRILECKLVLFEKQYPHMKSFSHLGSFLMKEDLKPAVLLHSFNETTRFCPKFYELIYEYLKRYYAQSYKLLLDKKRVLQLKRHQEERRYLYALGHNTSLPKEAWFTILSFSNPNLSELYEKSTDDLLSKPPFNRKKQ